MKSIIAIGSLLLVLLSSSCSIHKYEKLGVYRELGCTEYQALTQDSNINIIDVRTANEYEKSHIEGAVNASYFGGEFKEHILALNLDTSLTTLIYCETQHRSLFATKKLYKYGFRNIVDLKKGMMYWRKKGFPYVTP